MLAHTAAAVVDRSSAAPALDTVRPYTQSMDSQVAADRTAARIGSHKLARKQVVDHILAAGNHLHLHKNRHLLHTAKEKTRR